MKYCLIFAVVACAGFSQLAQAQPCDRNTYRLSTQTEVDAFPGDCTIVNRNLIIDQGDTVDPIVDLSPLANIIQVGRNLRIRDTEVTEISDLAGITSVGWSLQIQNNADLTSLQPLATVTSVGRDLAVVNNDSLASLAGLQNINNLGQSLQIQGNGLIDSLDGLASYNAIAENLIIRNNDLLTDTGVLAGISSVGRDLWVRDNAILPDLDDFAAITSVGRDARIQNNDALTEVSGLVKLTSVSRDFVLRQNDNLTFCDGAIPLLDEIDDGASGPGVAPTPDVGRNVVISGNGGVSCSSQANILAHATAPLFSQGFSEPKISISATILSSTLTYTMDLTAGPARATGVSFLNTLPAQITLATPSNASHTCAEGTVTASDGGTSVSFSDGLITGSSSCTVSVEVIGVLEGLAENTSGNLTFDLGDSGVSSATLIVDDTAPTITVQGDNPLILLKGEPFVDPGATAVDAVDGTVPVIASGDVDTDTVGDYIRSYAASDAVGNSSSEERTVTVVAPAVELSPVSVDFGEVRVGQTGTASTVTLSNPGGANLNVSDITAATSPFERVGGDCIAVPFSLAPGEACTLEYQFAPVTDGVAQQVLEIVSDSDSSPDQLTLAGEGLPTERSFTGPLPSGAIGTLTFTSQDIGCTFEDTPEFIPEAAAATPAPEGVSLVDGLAQFTITGCQPGATVSVTLDYGAPVPPDAEHWKVDSPWRSIAAVVGGTQVTFSLTDGGENDDDGVENGSIVDPSGLAQSRDANLPSTRPVAVPVNQPWALLGIIVGLLLMTNRRHQR